MSNTPPPSDGLILLVSPDATTPTEGQRGWGDDLRQRATSLIAVRIDPLVLERQMTSFLSVVGHLFQQADQQIQSPTGVQLSEVELSVEISAKGEVKLVAGGEVAGKGAIKLKFTRPAPTP